MNRFLLLFLLAACCASGRAQTTTTGVWVRPCDGSGPARPLWGHRDGVQVGLPGAHGPHGLLYLYHEPVVGPSGHPLNFISVEPIVGRARGFSELEHSGLDGRQGKRFWSADTPDFTPRDPDQAACGTVTSHGTTETLQVYIMVEPFDNGARPYLRLSFRSDLPGEVGLETFSAPGSAPMSACILSATMGNYARLRELHLEGEALSSLALWPDYKGHDFAPAREFALERLPRTPDGGVLVSATPDEKNPAAAKALGHWNFTGIPATQYWRLEPAEVTTGTLARVNGRYVYWRSSSPIPGGIAFENFELQRSFRPGEASVFGVTTGTLRTANPPAEGGGGR